MTIVPKKSILVVTLLIMIIIKVYTLEVITIKSGLNIDNSYLTLSTTMYSVIKNNPNYNKSLVFYNSDLGSELDLNNDYFSSKEGLELLTGSSNNIKFAQAYAGHQFGNFTMLGDGRAMIIGEHITKEKKRYDLHLKGSGVTPYSRRGDGKATLISTLREYVVSEAMHHLGVPTSRALSVIKTGETLRRERMHEGAILTRVATSHIRIATFQYASTKEDLNVIKELADYTINRHYSHLNKKENKYQLFLGEVISNQASLIAKWQSLGFIHGVMNTDNMLVSGETIDYGPCAFMDEYNPNTVFSSIDQDGRYSYGNQPHIASWNLARFAESLLSLLSDNITDAVSIANAELSKFEELFKMNYFRNMYLKFGLDDSTSSDSEFVLEFLRIMEKEKLDFTNSFRLLTIKNYDKISQSKEYYSWLERYNTRIQKIDIDELTKTMTENNPVIIPRNNTLQKALEFAAFNDSFNELTSLLEYYKDPYNYNKEYPDSVLFPYQDKEKFVSYCGT